MYTFILDRERLVIDRQIHGMDYWKYTHDNGYIQYFIDDFAEFGDMDTNGKQYFIDTLTNGSNELYAAYSMLPAELINKDGDPEVDFDFDDARQYIATGAFPSPEKLQANAASTGMTVDTKALNEL